jgi:L-2,4-diaminobutyrate decarboxylase
MFLIPGLNTCVLFRDGDRSYETFAQKASYLFDKTHEKDWYNGAKRTLECTKSSLGLHVYSMFRYYGDKFFGTYIDRMYDLASEFYDNISSTTDFESIVKPESNILCFRYHGNSKAADLNEINRQIRERLIKGGKFYIVQAEINEKVWLRTTIINPHTTINKLLELLDEIRSIADSPGLT